MTKIDKIKDKFFKVVLGDERNMKPVLRFILPDPIKRSMDWSQITIEPTNTVSKRYREGYSDLTAKTKMKNPQGEELDMDIYFLFEQKSTSEKDTPIQILNYQHLAWAKDLSEGKKMRVILPIVFYYGQNKWTVPIHFIEHFEVANDVKPYLLDFQYLLFDASKWDFRKEQHHELKDNVFLLTALALMKSSTNDDLESIREIFRFWRDRGFLDEKEDVVFFMMYISETKKIDMTHVGKLLEETNIDGGDMMLTLADRLRKEGRQEARKDFMQEGAFQAKLNTAKELMKYGVSIEIILKSTGLTMKEIESAPIQND